MSEPEKQSEAFMLGFEIQRLRDHMCKLLNDPKIAKDTLQQIYNSSILSVLELQQIRIDHPELVKEFASKNTLWPHLIGPSKGWVKTRMPEDAREIIYDLGLATSTLAPKINDDDDCIALEISSAIFELMNWRAQPHLRQFHEMEGPRKSVFSTLLGVECGDWWSRFFELPELAPNKASCLAWAEIVFDRLFLRYTVREAIEEEFEADRKTAETDGKRLRYDIDWMPKDETVAMEKLFSESGEIIDLPAGESEYYDKSCYIYTLLRPKSDNKLQSIKYAHLRKAENKYKKELDESYTEATHTIQMTKGYGDGTSQPLNSKELKRAKLLTKELGEALTAEYNNKVLEINNRPLSEKLFRRCAVQFIAGRLKTMATN
jgi:hypothetical protein